MLYKHGIWSQCVICLKITMAISCFVSTHWESLYSDVIWTLFLLGTCIIQFFTEEHRTIRNITPEQWCKYAIRLNYGIHWIISSWILLKSSMGEWTWLIIIALACNPWTLHFHHKRFILPITLIIYIAWGDFLYSIVGINIIFILVTFLQAQEYNRLPSTSHASNVIKRVAAYNAILHILEAVILWQLRCMHRFPYVFRWNPLIVGVFICVLACGWCHLFIKNTSVSRNSIIQSLPSSHFIAISLDSASKCSVCINCLTSLDMESSFRE